MRRFTLFALALFALVWAVCLASKVADQALPGHSYNDTFHTANYRAQLIRNVWSGNFPDLAPGIFMGQPLLSTGQAAVLYPTNLIGVLIPVPAVWFYLFDLWVHATLASAGMAWMLRRRGHRALTALTLGWVYANCSSFLLRASVGHWEMLHQIALFPWALGVWEAMGHARRTEARRWALAWGGVWGLLLLTRNPQMLLALLVVLVPLELWRLIARRRRMPISIRLEMLGASVIIAGLLAAVAIAPHLQGFSESYRFLMASVETAKSWPWLPFNAVALVSPQFLFGERATTYLGNWFPHESTLVVPWGVTALAIGGLALVFAWRRISRRGEAVLPLALVVGGVVIGMAGAMPWGDWMAAHVPLFGSFRAWGRASVLANLGVIMLAAEGFDALMDHRRRYWLARLGSVVGAVLCLALCYAGWMWLIVKGDAALTTLAETHLNGQPYANHTQLIPTLGDHLKHILRIDVVWYFVWLMLLVGAWGFSGGRFGKRAAIAIAALLVMGAAWQQHFHWEANTRPATLETKPGLTEWLIDLRGYVAPAPATVILSPSELATFGLQVEGIRGVMGTDSNASREFITWLNRCFGRPDEAYSLSPFSFDTVPSQVIAETGLLARVEQSLNANVRPSWISVDGYQVEVFLQAPPYAEVTGDAASLEVVSWHEDWAEFDVDSNTATTAIIREFPDSRWHAWINGERAEIRPEGAHIEIPVPAGGGRIELVFVDMPARVGISISLGAWLIFGLFGLIGLRRSRRAA